MKPLAAFVAATAISAHGTAAGADEDAPAQTPAATLCAATGSPDVMVEGRGMLRLSDVSACDPSTYEIIQGVFVNGEPAVRLLPAPGGAAAPEAADSVIVGGSPANRAGDAPPQ